MNIHQDNCCSSSKCARIAGFTSTVNVEDASTPSKCLAIMLDLMPTDNVNLPIYSRPNSMLISKT